MCVVLSAEAAAVVVSPCQHLKYHRHCRAACRWKPEEFLSVSVSEMNTNKVGIILINFRQVKIFLPFFLIHKRCAGPKSQAKKRLKQSACSN